MSPAGRTQQHLGLRQPAAIAFMSAPSPSVGVWRFGRKVRIRGKSAFVGFFGWAVGGQTGQAREAVRDFRKTACWYSFDALGFGYQAHKCGPHGSPWAVRTMSSATTQTKQPPAALPRSIGAPPIPALCARPKSLGKWQEGSDRE